MLCSRTLLSIYFICNNLHQPQYFLMRRANSLERTRMLGGIGGRRRRRRQRMNEMAGWHHGLNGRESEWTLGDGDGQGGLASCDSWGCEESDTTERLNWTELNLQEAAASGISQLNPTPPLETIRGSMVGFMLIFMCLFFCFYIVWQQITKKVNRQQQQLATIALASMINNNHQK